MPIGREAGLSEAEAARFDELRDRPRKSRGPGKLQARWGRLVFVLAALVSTRAEAFDCAKAHDAIEKAICADPAAKASDDAMSAAFLRVRKQLAPDQSKALLVNQRRWLRTRSDACFGGTSVAGCLIAANNERVAVLEPRPVDGHDLRLVLLETPRTKTAYELGLLLYKFPDPQTAAERTFNADVEKRIAIAPTQRDPDDSPGDDYESYETARVAFASNRLLSVKIDTYIWGGGPHPDDGSETINIDMTTGKNLQIDDLAGKAGRDAIVKDCDRQYANEEAERQSAVDPEIAAIVADQLKDAVETMANWTFGKDDATVELGRLDGYAVGHFDCTLGYPILRRLAKPGFPLP